MKPNVRVLGIDDGAFSKSDKTVLVVGALVRGKTELEAVMSATVTVDGNDATEKIAKMINNSKRKSQIKAVLLHGSTVAGFNLINLKELYRRTGKPVISVYRKKPDLEKVRKALEKIGKRPCTLSFSEYSQGMFSSEGISKEDSRELLDSLLVRSSIPEPVRYAHVIASGVTRGESTKRV